MKTTIEILFQVDVDDEVQKFLGQLAERVLPDVVLKAWASKVVTKAVAAELAERGVAFPDPCVTISHDGNMQRVATKESDGRETAADARFEVIGEGD